jgi:hypothetical protein
MATEQLKEFGGDPSIDTLLPKTCLLHELTRIRNPVRAYGSAEDASETFIDGDGI